MKRTGNIYHKIYDMNNLILADKKARKGKRYQKGIMDFDKDVKNNLVKLHFLFRNREYKTSKYFNFQIKEDKIRDISRLPYFPDRIGQHAIANIIEPILTTTFTSDTYSAIKGRGLHKASYAVRSTLNKNKFLKYCLKLDIKKFYPSISNKILKQLIRKKIKDIDVLKLLDEIIDSSKGLPLGNYLSQTLANFYLTYFDHYLKQNCLVKHYFRYCDDLVILSDNKDFLHEILLKIREYLKLNLELEIKSNYQIFPIESRGIDFCGYVVRRNYVKLRKRIKKRCAKKIFKNRNEKSMNSYAGWIKHCNGKHLKKKLWNGNYSQN